MHSAIGCQQFGWKASQEGSNPMTAANIMRLAVVSMTVVCCAASSAYAESVNIYQATLVEANQSTQEVSTEQLRRILADGSALVIDSRSRTEFDAGHIPGAHCLDAKPNAQVAAVEQLAKGNKSAALVLYCNGPFCNASRRIAQKLVVSGFTNVRQYQLGIPIWRALGGPTQIELQGIVRIFNADRTAIFIDARPAKDFAKGSLPGAYNLTAENANDTIKKLAAGKLENPPLPNDDFNRRIVLFGSDAGGAQKLAQVLSKKPWHNVAYFPGRFDVLAAAVRAK
jgi:rhodanese-related sulfurtransferase